MRKEIDKKIYWKEWFAWYPVTVFHSKEKKETRVWLERIWKVTFPVPCFGPVFDDTISLYSLEKPSNLEFVL